MSVIGHEASNGVSSSTGPFSSYVEASFAHQCTSEAGSTAGVLPSSTQLEQMIRTPRRLKHMLRSNNWPLGHECRRQLWIQLSQLGHHPSTPESYHNMASQTFGQGESEHGVCLPNFVDPTHVPHYHLTSEGVRASKRLVCVLATACPDVTFAPVLPAMAALMLHYAGEAESYACLHALLQDRFLAQTNISYDASRYVLRDLAKKYAKNTYQYINKYGLQIEGVLEDWIWWIFTDLKFSYLVRIIDCFLFEGPKVLYRVALAILILYHKHVVKNTRKKPDPVLICNLSQFCEDMPVSVDVLLKVAFDIRGLSRKYITKLTLKKEKHVADQRRFAPLPQSLPKSASCASLNLLVSPSSKEHLDSLGVSSQLIEPKQWKLLWSWLPTRMTIERPQLLYTSAEHGTSLSTFYGKVEQQDQTLILIKTTADEVIGAYCSMSWAERHNNVGSYYGTGETFLFSLVPKTCKYSWVGLAGDGRGKKTSENLFMSADMTHIMIGGGNGVALLIDEDMFHGRSETCDTFNNQPLVSAGDFQCAVVQVYGFV